MVLCDALLQFPRDSNHLQPRQFIPFDQQTKEDLHKLDKIVIDYYCEIEDRIDQNKQNKIDTRQEILDTSRAVMSLHRRLLEHFRQTEKNCYTCCSLHWCYYTRKHEEEFERAVIEHRTIEQEDLHDHCCDEWQQAPSPKEVISHLRDLLIEEDIKQNGITLEEAQAKWNK